MRKYSLHIGREVESLWGFQQSVFSIVVTKLIVYSQVNCTLNLKITYFETNLSLSVMIEVIDKTIIIQTAKPLSIYIAPERNPFIIN